MRTLVKLLIILAVLAGIGYAAWKPVMAYIAKRNEVVWRTAKVEQGSIIAVVNSTGTIKPKLQVSVGSFVSGPITELHVEFNQEVKQGELLAKIDPRLYDAAVLRDEASLANREADVYRIKAQLQQAINDEKRAIALRDEDKTFIAQAEMDKFTFSRLGLEAQLKVSETSVAQAQASLQTSKINRDYTEIKAPVDGIVINRKIDPGQTLAAQFQTPELFIIAPDMRNEMHIHANVDEADIGQIRQAQEKKHPVTFTVDAYPEELFTGNILEIRLSSTALQNVVTYPVVVTATNPDLKLLPGMTASLSFQVDDRQNVTKLPNATLRFYPEARFVRPEDLPILEGISATQPKDSAEFGGQGASQSSQSAKERADTRKKRSQRHVWVAEGQKLRAIPVTVGLTDGQFTEVVQGDLKAGQELVTGIQPKKPPGTP